MIVRNLALCAHDTGNYLLNIGPRADGSVPEASAKILAATGKWLERNGASIYQSERCTVSRSQFAGFTRKGDTLYMHVYYWPGQTVALGGLVSKVKSARLLATGKEVKFDQEPFRVRFLGLPEKPPDDPVTTIAIECDSEPRQDMDAVRKQRPRLNA
jgi:alpha-L-fucosidase